MVMIAVLCSALGCRELVLPGPPMSHAWCQMRLVTMQAILAEQVAGDTGEELVEMRCVAGVRV